MAIPWRRSSCLVFVLGLAFVVPARAEEADTVDVRSRTGVSLKLEIPKRWTAELEYQNRRVDDLGTQRGNYFGAGAAYGVTRHLDVLASYRLADGDGWTSQRWAAGLQYERKPGDWRISFRSLLQHRTERADDDEAGGAGSTFLRTRVRGERRLTARLDAYASLEPCFAFGADYAVDHWRDTVGLQYEIGKHARVDVYYAYRPDYGKSYNRTFHTFGVTLGLNAAIGGRKAKAASTPHEP